VGPIPGVFPDSVIHIEASSGVEGQMNVINWQLPSDPTVLGVEIRFSYTEFGVPPEPTEGWYVDRVGVTENPNNRVIHHGLVNGVTYYYALFTFDALNQYSTGVTSHSTPKDLAPPDEITNLTLDTSTSNQLKLSWENPASPDFAGVIIRKSTAESPADRNAGSAAPTGLANNCGYSDGVIPVSASNNSSWTDTSISNGQITYYKIYTYDTECNYSFLGEAVDGAAPLLPVSGLKAFPGYQRVYLEWDLSGGQTAEYIIRYNTTGDPITSETDGLPVKTVVNPLDPGIVLPPVDAAPQNVIEHAEQDGGGPLDTDKTYYYAVFARSVAGILSPPRHVSVVLSSAMTELHYDGFEGTHDFCTTYGVRDLDTAVSHIFWGPVTDSGMAFEGNGFAFSGALVEASDNCATATGWSAGGSYARQQDSWMSYDLGDQSTAQRIILAYRVNYREDARDCHYPQYLQFKIYVSTDGDEPDTNAIYVGDTTEQYWSYSSWSGWFLRVVDLTPYKSATMKLGIYMNSDDDGCCSCWGDTTSGGVRLDTLRINVQN